MLLKDLLLDNRYRIINLLGTGAMGAVYLALDERLSCSVAVKGTIFGQARLDEKTTGELRRAFEREAKLLANLQHESIPHVSDFFESEGEQYLVMEYIAGEDLYEQALTRHNGGGRFETSEVIDWTLQILDALDYLHSQDEPVIHKDIKLSNIKISPRGRAKLLDFGVAKGFAGEMTRVEAGSLQMGTEEYAPLEQFLKFPSAAAQTLKQALEIKHAARVQEFLNAPTDARTDLYSLAVTVYRLLTGKFPVDYLPRALANWENQDDPIISIYELNHDVPIEVSNVLMRALELDKKDRPESAAAMKFYLERAWADSRQSATAIVTTDFERELSEEKMLRANAEAELARTNLRLREAEDRARALSAKTGKSGFLAQAANRKYLVSIALVFFAVITAAFTFSLRSQPQKAVVTDYLERADEFMAQKNYAAAIQEFTRIIDLKDADTDSKHRALAWRGEAKRKNEDYQGAIEDYTAAIEIDAGDVFALTNRADIFCRQNKDYERAAKDFSRVFELKPNYDFLFEKRGYCAESRKRYADAETDYSQAIALDDSESWTYFRRGVVYLFQKKAEKAVADFDQTIKLTPDDWTAYANRALAHEALGNRKKAEEDFKLSAEIKQKIVSSDK